MFVYLFQTAYIQEKKNYFFYQLVNKGLRGSH